MQEINIHWEGPFCIDDILENKIDQSKYAISGSSIGLYQIYGSHPLYGNGVLVYIGRTKDKKGFKSRLKDRWVIENGNDSENVKVYLGTVFSDKVELKSNEIEKMIDKSEVLLINSLKPAFNSSNIQSVKEEMSRNRYIVYNYGNYRSLYPIVDSNYFWDEFKNYIIVDKLAKELGKKIVKEDDSYGFYFGIVGKYDIWFGVDYELWDKKNIPLTLQVYSYDSENMKKIEVLSDFTHYKYATGEIAYTYFKSLNVREELESYEKEINILKEKVKEKLND